MSSNNEQWLSNGDCNLCRREKYCSKPCKANKTEVKRNNVYRSYFSGITGKAKEDMRKVSANKDAK